MLSRASVWNECSKQHCDETSNRLLDQLVLSPGPGYLPPSSSIKAFISSVRTLKNNYLWKWVPSWLCFQKPFQFYILWRVQIIFPQLEPGNCWKQSLIELSSTHKHHHVGNSWMVLNRHQSVNGYTLMWLWREPWVETGFGGWGKCINMCGEWKRTRSHVKWCHWSGPETSPYPQAFHVKCPWEQGSEVVSGQPLSLPLGSQSPQVSPIG